jgi:hypothetical protein
MNHKIKSLKGQPDSIIVKSIKMFFYIYILSSLFTLFFFLKDVNLFQHEDPFISDEEKELLDNDINVISIRSSKLKVNIDLNGGKILNGYFVTERGFNKKILNNNMNKKNYLASSWKVNVSNEDILSELKTIDFEKIVFYVVENDKNNTLSDENDTKCIVLESSQLTSYGTFIIRKKIEIVDYNVIVTDSITLEEGLFSSNINIKPLHSAFIIDTKELCYNHFYFLSEGISLIENNKRKVFNYKDLVKKETIVFNSNQSEGEAVGFLAMQSLKSIIFPKLDLSSISKNDVVLRKISEDNIDIFQILLQKTFQESFNLSKNHFESSSSFFIGPRSIDLLNKKPFKSYDKFVNISFAPVNFLVRNTYKIINKSLDFVSLPAVLFLIIFILELISFFLGVNVKEVESFSKQIENSTSNGKPVTKSSIRNFILKCIYPICVFFFYYFILIRASYFIDVRKFLWNPSILHKDLLGFFSFGGYFNLDNLNSIPYISKIFSISLLYSVFLYNIVKTNTKNIFLVVIILLFPVPQLSIILQFFLVISMVISAFFSYFKKK